MYENGFIHIRMMLCHRRYVAMSGLGRMRSSKIGSGEGEQGKDRGITIRSTTQISKTMFQI